MNDVQFDHEGFRSLQASARNGVEDRRPERVNRALSAQQTIGGGGGGAPISLLQLLGGAGDGEGPVAPGLKQPQ